MSEALARELPANEPDRGFLTARISWRNLWRNRRRTWLTSGGIAFAVLLVVFFMSMQFGQYDIMMDNATSLMVGHIEIQNAAFPEDNRFEETVPNASALVAEVEATPGVISVASRVEVFALASVGERSFGTQLLGIDIAAEQKTVRMVKMLSSGREIQGSGEAVIGAALARNLGAKVGDEMVLLGSGKEGGVAAMVVTVVGLLATGINELDRSLTLADISEVQAAFGLDDEVHTLVLKVEHLDRSQRIADGLAKRLPDDLVVRNWDEVLPELKQAIEVDKIGGQLMYWIIMLLVVFSAVNSFIMTVFERTREFGMLRAIGMRPLKIIAMVQLEALFLCLLGIAIGVGVATPLVYWLAEVGIYLGQEMEAYATQFYMPDRMYGAFSWRAFGTAPLVMLIGTQIAALLPSLRIRHLKPVEALREI